MPGLRGVQREAHRFRIPHLADDEHVGRLADGGTQRAHEVRHVAADLLVLDQAEAVLVLVLDRVFDRHDVPALALVDVAR